MKIERLLESNFEVGECLRWNQKLQILSWVEILSGKYYEAVFSPKLTITREISISGELGAALPKGSDVYLLHENTISLLLPNDEVRTLYVDTEMPRSLRFNDANFDSRGRIVAGIMHKEGDKGHGSVIRFTPENLVYENLVKNWTIPNGITWSPNQSQIYIAESIGGKIFRASYNSEKLHFQEFLSINNADGYPDGLEMDLDGNILVALWAGSKIRKFSPEGVFISELSVPPTNPTSICYVKSLDSTFIISGRQHIEAPGDLDGALYAIKGSW